MKSILTRLTFIFIYFLIISTLHAQGYCIKVKIKDLKDSTLILGYHMDGKMLAKDTVVTDKQGVAVFDGKEKLPGGMYFIFLPSKNIFNILVSDDQQFEIETVKDDFLKDMKVKGSDENQLFFDYERFLDKKGEEMQKWRKHQQTVKTKKDSLEIVNKEIDRINKEVEAEIDRIIKTNPKTFFAKFLTATKSIEIPETTKNEKGEPIDANFDYYYYKNHYFDNIDFSDDRLLRTAIFRPKIMDFIEKRVVQIPDSMIVEVNKVFAKAKANKEVFKYVVGTYYNYFNNSDIMGMDAVFVNIADYYLRGEADWNDTSYIRKLRERVDKVRPTLIGKTAPDFTVPTIKNKLFPNFRLSMLKSDYTAVYFYDPHCSVCQKETPIMKNVADRMIKFGLSTVFFYSQGDTVEWEKYVKEKELGPINVWSPYTNKPKDDFNIEGVPRLYLLDKDKKIIAKGILGEQCEKILVDRLFFDATKDAEGKEKIKKIKAFIDKFDTVEGLDVVKEIIFNYKFENDEKSDIEKYIESQIKKFEKETQSKNN